MPPPHILPPGEATGREAKRAPTCELSSGVSGAPLVGSLVGCGPRDAPGVGKGIVPLRPPARTSRRDLESHPFGPMDAFWRAARLWEGAAHGHARCKRAPGADSSSSTLASPEANKGLRNEGQKAGKGAGALGKHPHRMKAKTQGW